jgi:hypothetical protein
LIPFLLLSGATMIYMGLHGAPTPWALHGPHSSTPSGRRLPLLRESTSREETPVTVEAPAGVVDEPEAIAFEEPAAVVIEEPVAGRPVPLPLERVVVEEVGPAQTFTQSDALIGELMMELTTVRDELTSLRERVETLSSPTQPAAAAGPEPAVEPPAPAPVRRRRTRASVSQEAVTA